ncbi:MAG: DUF402 domain-containing protein [Clostridiales bacterium]|nr:DUF402 domain-containing protein [Clostridiales bacterium]
MLLIQEKDIRRSEWTRILSRSFATESFSSRDLSGEIALIRIDKTKSPLFVTTNGRQYKIVDDGFRWLQIAPKDANWWLTAMFTQDGEALQYYFDVTLENRVSSGGNSTFLDLFLDVVMLPGGECILLDKDELDEALTQSVITPEQHAFAWKTANMLLEALPRRHEELHAFCQQHRRKLETLL